MFDNSGDKILFESYLHQYFDVKSNTFFLNLVNQTPFGFDRTGVKASDETREKQSVSAIRREEEIKKDLARWNHRSEAISKAHSNISNDPIRAVVRSKNMSLSNQKNNDEIAADPVRYRKRTENKSVAAIKANAKIAADPVRVSIRNKKRSDFQLTEVCQYDLDGNFIQKFESQKEAAVFLGKNNPSGISHCITGKSKTYLGFIWKGKGRVKKKIALREQT